MYQIDELIHEETKIEIWILENVNLVAKKKK